jgi:hypothetical protein
MLLVNGVAIAMVVIGAINSGRQPISNFPAKMLFGIFSRIQRNHFADFYGRCNCKFPNNSAVIFCGFYPFSCVQN